MVDPAPRSGAHGPSDPAAATSGGGTRRFPNVNTWLACLCVAFGIALLIVIPGQVGKPPVLFGISVSDLDPALFPRVVAGGFIVIGLWYLNESRNIVEDNELLALRRGAVINIAVTLLVFFAYAYFLVPLGFVIASALTMAFLSIFYGARNVFGIAITSLVIPLAVYYVFTIYLQVTLPTMPEALRWN